MNKSVIWVSTFIIFSSQFLLAESQPIVSKNDGTHTLMDIYKTVGKGVLKISTQMPFLSNMNSPVLN
jgi:hypothetical protein